MPTDRNIGDRLIKLEMGLREAQIEIAALEKKVAYYDKMAIKWGGILMGATVVGALISGHFDVLKAKIIGLFQ